MGEEEKQKGESTEQNAQRKQVKQNARNGVHGENRRKGPTNTRGQTWNKIRRMGTLEVRLILLRWNTGIKSKTRRRNRKISRINIRSMGIAPLSRERILDLGPLRDVTRQGRRRRCTAFRFCLWDRMERKEVVRRHDYAIANQSSTELGGKHKGRLPLIQLLRPTNVPLPHHLTQPTVQGGLEGGGRRRVGT
jgi:hypothetical protein